MLAVRAVRHGLAATVAVLLVAVVVGGLAFGAWQRGEDRLAGLTGRAHGEIVAVGAGGDPAVVRVRWQRPGSGTVHSDVAIGESVPPVGARVQVAFDPADPGRVTLPGSAAIESTGRALAGVASLCVVVAGVLVAGAVRFAVAARAGSHEPRPLTVRRLRLQHGLLARSWIEFEAAPQRWFPVYFDPALVTVPSPAEVAVHGDPRRDRWIAMTVDGRRIYPSGPVRASEPRGRRTDNPARPDADTARRAREATLARQLRVDLAFAAPAPLVGLFWAFLDGGGIASWLGATVVAATVGPWTCAYRGSDPS
ncbi:MAG: hypothetical protein GEV09_13035 [Pseudonocardiaceae bacterium]|nr:hypothetical protein [Pseudonocardiaceae bacterium]